MSTDKENNKKRDKELAESLHPETHKGPQKDEHTNQYGDQDEQIKTQ